MILYELQRLQGSYYYGLLYCWYQGEFPCSRASTIFLLPLDGYKLDESFGWKFFLDCSNVVVSVHAWQQPLAPLDHAYLFLLVTIFSFNSSTLTWLGMDCRTSFWLFAIACIYLLLCFCLVQGSSKSNKNWLIYLCCKFAGFFDWHFLPLTLGHVYSCNCLSDFRDWILIKKCLSRTNHFIQLAKFKAGLLFGLLVSRFPQVPKESFSGQGHFSPTSIVPPKEFYKLPKYHLVHFLRWAT